MSPQKLLDLEAHLGFEVPETYRSFLSISDGGRPVAGYFSPRIGVTEFLGVGQIRKTSTQMSGRLPARCLPFANASGGNLLLLSSSGPLAGAVFFWDHEAEGDQGAAVERVANSFDEFALRLGVVPDEDLVGYKVLSVEIDPEFLREIKEQERLDALKHTIQWPPSD